jgi:hypothetical protein
VEVSNVSLRTKTLELAMRKAGVKALLKTMQLKKNTFGVEHAESHC